MGLIFSSFLSVALACCLSFQSVVYGSAVLSIPKVVQPTSGTPHLAKLKLCGH